MRSANCQCIRRPRPWKDSEIYRANRSGRDPAKFPVRTLRCECRRPRCRAPRVSPSGESRSTIPSDAFPIRSSLDSLMGALHEERQTQLPTLRAMAAKNRWMNSVLPWRANAAVCAPAFNNFEVTGQRCVHHNERIVDLARSLAVLACTVLNQC